MSVEIGAIRVAAASADRLGEGCVWDPDGGWLWWVDIAPDGRVHRLDAASGQVQTWGPLRFPSTIALRRDGSAMLATLDGVGPLSTVTGAQDVFVTPEDESDGNRPNDGACDPQGRFWLGSMQQNIAADGRDLDLVRSSGKLWRIESDRTVELMAEGIGVANMALWSPDGSTFYLADSSAQVIWAYAFDGPSGTISERRVFSDEKAYGYPDGATIDEDGYIWNARWDAGVVLRLDPKGRIDRVIEVPVNRPTNCVFGGPDLSTLYVTSSRANLPADVLARYPDAGHLLAIETNARGLIRHRTAL